MAWLGKVSLGGFPDLAGAVTKLSESVKNIEKNFDSALGLEEKSEAGDESRSSWVSTDKKALFDPVMAFMGHKSGATESVEKAGTPESSSPIKEHTLSTTEHVPIQTLSPHDQIEKHETVIQVPEIQDDTSANVKSDEEQDISVRSKSDTCYEMSTVPAEAGMPQTSYEETLAVVQALKSKDDTEVKPADESENGEWNIVAKELSGHETGGEEVQSHEEASHADVIQDGSHLEMERSEDTAGKASLGCNEVMYTQITSIEAGGSDIPSTNTFDDQNSAGIPTQTNQKLNILSKDASHDSEPRISEVVKQIESGDKVHPLGSEISITDIMDPDPEVEKLKREMKMLESALQGAARQAQSKADEIAKLMNENEQMKSTIQDLMMRTSDAEIDALREEFHQKVSTLEKKVYALARERDALKREQSRKSDVASLLKEKDEIISQVMAEGEELSKKQAAQEAQIRKLRAQIREFEEEKQRLNSKIQVEEAKVESIKKDKSATEKLLQETVEKNQAELAAQKEFYINALNAAKDAQVLAESRANNEARVELEMRLREAGEREEALVHTIEELRQTLSRTEQQSVFREDMLRRDLDDLRKRCQSSELRCEELVMQVPESTRPLLRQIEAMQETTARRAEVWAGVERTLNTRLQDAEAKAASAEEKERSMNEKLSQTLSRMSVLETQVSCLRTEQMQLSRSLEKERQKASENRQEYLAVQEVAATHEVRAKQLEDEIKELRIRHKHQLLEEIERKKLLEQELERERAARLNVERSAQLTSSILNQTPGSKYPNVHYYDNGTDTALRKYSSAGSIISMEEGFFLQSSLDSSDRVTPEARTPSETTMSPYFSKGMMPSAIGNLEATLRQKDGELSSYITRLASLESVRDSLAEELVKMTEQCEKLRTEITVLPSLKAELDALRRRHSAALELMGERDEELEELRADIVDLKEMYREQIDLLVNKIQTLGACVDDD